MTSLSSSTSTLTSSQGQDSSLADDYLNCFKGKPVQIKNAVMMLNEMFPPPRAPQYKVTSQTGPPNNPTFSMVSIFTFECLNPISLEENKCVAICTEFTFRYFHTSYCVTLQGLLVGANNGMKINLFGCIFGPEIQLPFALHNFRLLLGLLHPRSNIFRRGQVQKGGQIGLLTKGHWVDLRFQN